MPTASAGSALSAICQSGTSAVMGGSVGGGATGGTWSGGAGTWTNESDPANATYTAGAGESGEITLTLTTSGGECGTTTDTKTIIVNPVNSAESPSSTPELCINTALTNITHATAGATGIGAATGLPTGVTAAWSSNTITISGTPTESGVFDYSIPLTGGCGEVSATGTITVNGPNTVITVNSIAVPVEEGDVVWHGSESNDWENPLNWYYYNGTNFVIPGTPPSPSTNAFVVPSSVGGDCVGSNDSPIVTTTGSGEVNSLVIENTTLELEPNATLEVHGDFMNYGTFIAGTGSTVKFDGSSAQKIGGNTPTTFHNLTLDNSGTLAYHLELDEDINVTNNLTLTKGILNLNQQSIDLGTTGTIVGENNSNYIFCECPSAYIRAVRPINTAGTAVDPGNIGLSITPSAGKPLGNVEIIRRHERVLDADGLPESISRVYEVKNASGGSVDNNGTLNATIAVKYLNHELNGFDPALLSIYRQPDLTVDTWFEYGGSINTSTQHAIFEGWNAFSGITLGEFNQPLPVTYLGMEGECSGKGYVELIWETASENNSSHFVIERSRDGFEWHTTATVPAAGSSNQTIQYTHHDLTSGRYFEGYYRLRQVDFDGKETELPAIAVFCDTKGETTLELYPNPTSGPVNVYIYSEHGENVITTLVMTDALGRKIQEIPLMLKSGGNLIEMNVSDLQQGVYNITLYQPDNSALTKRLVKH